MLAYLRTKLRVEFCKHIVMLQQHCVVYMPFCDAKHGHSLHGAMGHGLVEH